MFCRYGCGHIAKYRTKAGKNICSPSPSSCPANRKKNSEGLKRAHIEGRMPGFSDGQRLFGGEKTAALIKKKREHRLQNLPFDDLSGSEKRERIMIEQKHKCAECGCDPIHNGNPLRFQLDHINSEKVDGKKDESRKNLRLICPNCHSQSKTYCSKSATKEGRRKIAEAASIKSQKEVKEGTHPFLSQNRYY